MLQPPTPLKPRRAVAPGEEGFDCFIVDSGECYASIQINGEWNEVLKYEPGGFFGERALLRPGLTGKLESSQQEGRAATVTARNDVKVLKLSRLEDQWIGAFRHRGRDEFVSMIEERDHKEHELRGLLAGVAGGRAAAGASSYGARGVHGMALSRASQAGSYQQWCCKMVDFSMG
eukprot:Skav233986  [mRNA]  locus=scaffold1008:902058:905176:+ [translate_table: standard]